MSRTQIALNLHSLQLERSKLCCCLHQLVVILDRQSGRLGFFTVWKNALLTVAANLLA
jgi:hypothetical protein